MNCEKSKISCFKRWLYFCMVACGVLLSTLDSSMINVALPAIMRHFRLEIGEVKLIVLVYLMVITFSLVFWGRIADQLGKGRVFLGGIAVFVSGSVICSVAGSFHLLVAARCIQALGASMMMSAGPAIIKLISPAGELGRSLGLAGIATSLGLMSGPVISGVVLTYFSWRAVFLVSVPFGVLIFLIGICTLLPELSKLEQRQKVTFDWNGGMLWVTLVSTYVLLVNGSFASRIEGVLLCAACIVLLIAFLWVERKSRDPILPVILMHRRFFWAGVSTAAISFASLFIVLIIMPFYLDYALQYPVSRIGLVMMAVPVSLVVLSPLSGWLYDRLGNARLISTCGLLISSIAVLALMRLHSESHFASIFWRLAMLGAGQSIFLSPNSASVLTRVEEHFSGITSGILATARNFGMLTGAALAGGGFSFFFTIYSGGAVLQDYKAAHVQPFMQAHHLTLAVALVLLLVAIAISFTRNS